MFWPSILWVYSSYFSDSIRHRGTISKHLDTASRLSKYYRRIGELLATVGTDFPCQFLLGLGVHNIFTQNRLTVKTTGYLRLACCLS